MLDNNGLRMFRCDECKVNKMVVKKSVADSLILEMPTMATTVDTTPQFSWRWLQFFT